MFKNKSFLIVASLSLFSLLLSGCISAAQHQRDLHSAQEQEMTVGIVQKEIRVGMSQSDVATVENGDNDELLLASSTCTCTCQCERCALSVTCYHPELCGSCASQCMEACENHNCGAFISGSGNCD